MIKKKQTRIMLDVSPHPQIAVKDRCNVKFKDKVH